MNLDLALNPVKNSFPQTYPLCDALARKISINISCSDESSVSWIDAPKLYKMIHLHIRQSSPLSLIQSRCNTVLKVITRQLPWWRSLKYRFYSRQLTKSPFIDTKMSFLSYNCNIGITTHEANTQIQIWSWDQHLSKIDSPWTSLQKLRDWLTIKANVWAKQTVYKLCHHFQWLK